MSDDRTCGLSTLDLQRLHDACRVIDECLDDPPYLVGSANERADFRDVDVRSIMSDEDFDAVFGGRPGLWSLLCMSVSAYLSQVTGLPIDYQVQRQSEANDKFGGGMRNPVGMNGTRWFAGGGDATRFVISSSQDSEVET